jgi:hypothetical protein
MLMQLGLARENLKQAIAGKTRGDKTPQDLKRYG